MSDQTRGNATKNKTGTVPITDVVRSGYYTVLGKGTVPKQTAIMKAKFFSSIAEEKIQGMGEGLHLSSLKPHGEWFI